MNFSQYASVIIEGGIPKPLDYGVPQELLGKVKEGSRVEIPVRGKPRTGVVKYLKKQGIPQALPITKLLTHDLPADLVKLADWMARYYCTQPSHILRMMIPGSIRKEVAAKKQLTIDIKEKRETLRKACSEMQNAQPAQARLLEVLLKGKTLLTEVLEAAEAHRSSVDALVNKGWIELREVLIDRSPLDGQEYFPTKPKTLNEEQKIALQDIAASLGTFQVHLLYGVTGSGKTEVYLQAIERALAHDLGVIMLVPEIALTPQTVERFRSRFEGQIAVLHHRLSEGERRDEWSRIRTGKAQIVIGPRSAIFSPLPNLGLIIVDEEHEGSYKQDQGYHARDVAIVRGKFTNSTVILGSATPSLESMYNCQIGKYKLSKLTIRADHANMPTVKTIDMTNERSLLSEELLGEIKKRFCAGEQTLLFLNRRGYHSMLYCSGCKEAIGCPHCDVSLTFHRGNNKLTCHMCSYTLSPPPRSCPTCGAADPLAFRGAGTEQIERAIRAIFPEVRTIRVDADTTRHKGSHERLLRAFRSGKADVLIGTQMIAKGLHFPQVTLVGVLNADLSLNLPDFRASENVFQLLTQVSGRSGRGALPGKVLIQTRMQDNETIQLASHQDYDAFFKKELEARKLFNYPPFTHLIKLTFSGPDAKATEKCAIDMWNRLAKHLEDILPVTPCGHPKIKDRYRFQFILRGKSVYTLNQEIQKAYPTLTKDLRLQIDVDPISTYF